MFFSNLAHSPQLGHNLIGLVRMRPRKIVIQVDVALVLDCRALKVREIETTGTLFRLMGNYPILIYP